MPTDRVLVEIVTAANMAGVEQAKAGFLSLNAATLGLGVALGVLVMGGKSMIEIAERQQKAHLDLAQAVKVSGGNITQTDAYLRSYINTNRSYLSSQSDVETSYGALLRSGIPVTEAQKDLNRATDLAALKGISLTDATALLIAAEHGRTKGLIDLGITTAKYTDAQGNVINQGKNMAKVMQEIDDKTKHGRETLTETQQISNRLSNDWQDLATKGGPLLLTAEDNVIKKASEIYDWFDKTGKDDKLWATISDRLVKMGQWIKQYILDPLDKARGSGHFGGIAGVDWIPDNGTVGPAFGAGGRASGGPVSAGKTYLVGEHGPEPLIMGSSGGFVVPNRALGGGNQIHIHLDGIYAGDGPSLDILANKIALRLGYATGR